MQLVKFLTMLKKTFFLNKKIIPLIIKYEMIYECVIIYSTNSLTVCKFYSKKKFLSILAS